MLRWNRDRRLPPRRELAVQAQLVHVVNLSGAGQWEAVRELDGVLAGWRLPRNTAHRLLLAAAPVLATSAALDLLVQYDPADALVVVELYDEQGARVYGIDEWVGLGAPRADLGTVLAFQPESGAGRGLSAAGAAGAGRLPA